MTTFTEQAREREDFLGDGGIPNGLPMGTGQLVNLFNTVLSAFTPKLNRDTTGGAYLYTDMQVSPGVPSGGDTTNTNPSSSGSSSSLLSSNSNVLWWVLGISAVGTLGVIYMVKKKRANKS